MVYGAEVRAALMLSAAQHGTMPGTCGNRKERTAHLCARFSQLFTIRRPAEAGWVLARLFRQAWLWPACWRLYPQ